MSRVISLLTVLLGGCFVSAGMSYSPSSTITVQRAVDPMPTEIKDGTATINFRLGVNFDIGGVGVHHAWYAARVLRSASGMPHQPNISGTHTRFDVDLPVRFGPKQLLGLRASYAYEKYDKFNSKSGGGGLTEGSGHHGGLSLVTINKDIQLNVLVGKYEMTSTADFMNDSANPSLGIRTWDIDVGITLRFIPSGTLISRYVYEPGPILTSSVCGWRLSKDGGGFVCY